MSVKRSGLGKNLSALLGNAHAVSTLSEKSESSGRDERSERPESSDTNHTDIKRLPLEALHPGKYQPRRVMEKEPLQELADSIRQQGLLQPILVRKLANNHYEIIAGERRFKAAKLAGLHEIPVIVHQVNDETTMAIALVENLQREDLNPIDQARAMARLNHEFSLTHQEIAQILSKSRAAVSNFLRLLSLSTEVITLVEKGDLDMGHARSLLTLEENQQLQAAKQIIAKNLSVRKTEDLVARMKENEQNKAKPKKKLSTDYPLSVQAKISDLERRLETKIVVNHNDDGNGSLVIQYDSIQGLEDMLALIAS
jgi:ParB family chromosome partitioning protein